MVNLQYAHKCGQLFSVQIHKEKDAVEYRILLINY